MRAAWTVLALLLASCAQLSDVQDYASASHQLANYRELTVRFRDTYQRELPYLPKAAESLARDNDARRARAYHELLQIQQIVALYMQTLGRLAGDHAAELGKAGGSLSEGIASLPEFGITAKHADAYGKLAAQISKVLASDFQQQQVKTLIRAADPDLQTLLTAMLELTAVYEQTHANERKTVLGMLEVELAYTKAPRDRLLSALGRAQMQERTAEYQAVQRKYGTLAKGIAAIALGHKALLDNLDQLDHAATRAVVQEFTQQIRASTELLATTDRGDPAGAP